MGRPKKVTVEQLVEGVDPYIAGTEIPVVTEYALSMGITKVRLYQLAKESDELNDAIKKITDTKEVVLEKGALTGKFNSTMAIFSLKQMGWTDKKEDEGDRTVTVKFEAAEDYGN